MYNGRPVTGEEKPITRREAVVTALSGIGWICAVAGLVVAGGMGFHGWSTELQQDLDRIRAERDVIDAEHERMRNAFIRGTVTVNQYREFIGLPPIK